MTRNKALSNIGAMLYAMLCYAVLCYDTLPECEGGLRTAVTVRYQVGNLYFASNFDTKAANLRSIYLSLRAK